MNEIVEVIQRYSAWLYVLLAILILRQIRLLWRAAREHDTSLFGLERETATGKAVRALVSLMLYAAIGLAVYSITSVAPPPAEEPESAPAILRTPPTAILPTDTPTAPPYTPTRPPARIVTRTPEGG